MKCTTMPRVFLGNKTTIMKAKVFNDLVDEVSDIFGVSKEDVFTKTKKRRVVEARYALYYMCERKKMPLIYIQEFMGDNGYSIDHPTVIYGIKRVKDKIRRDPDYKTYIKR